MTADLMTQMHLETGSHHFDLQIPTTDDWVPLILEPAARTAHQLGIVLPMIVRACVKTWNGQPLDRARSNTLAADGEAMRAILSRMWGVLERMRETGRVFVQCPSCRAWEADLELIGVSLAVRAPTWPIFEGPYFASPALGAQRKPPVRPPIPRTSQIRFELPSSKLGLVSPLTSRAFGRDPGPPAPRDPAELDIEDMDKTGPGYEALLHLSSLLQPNASLDTLQAMPVVDFLFLDFVYYLTHCADVADDTAGRMRCGNCSSEMIPVQ